MPIPHPCKDLLLTVAIAHTTGAHDYPGRGGSSSQSESQHRLWCLGRLDIGQCRGGWVSGRASAFARFAVEPNKNCHEQTVLAPNSKCTNAQTHKRTNP